MKEMEHKQQENINLLWAVTLAASFHVDPGVLKSRRTMVDVIYDGDDENSQEVLVFTCIFTRLSQVRIGV